MNIRIFIVLFLACLAAGCNKRDDATTTANTMLGIDCIFDAGADKIRIHNTTADECMERMRDRILMRNRELQALHDRNFELEVLVKNNCIPPLLKFDPARPPPSDPVQNDKILAECMQVQYEDSVGPYDATKGSIVYRAEFVTRARTVAWNHYVQDLLCGANLWLYVHQPAKRAMEYPHSTFNEDDVRRQLTYVATHQLEPLSWIATWQDPFPADGFCGKIDAQSCSRDQDIIISELVDGIYEKGIGPRDLHPPIQPQHLTQLWHDANRNLYTKWRDRDLTVHQQLCDNVRRTKRTDTWALPPTGLSDEEIAALACINPPTKKK